MNFQYFWPNIVKVWTGYWKEFLFEGLRVTLGFTAIAVCFGVLLGIFVAILKMSKSKIIRFFITVYIEVIRGTPILLQLYLFVFALPQVFTFLDLSTPTWVAVALSINSSAYVSEVIRSGIQAVDKGQTEAARSIGMSAMQTMFIVVLPQAVKNSFPAIGNEFVVNIKDSSVLSAISVTDLFFQSNGVAGSLFLYTETMAVTALIYLVLTFTTTRVLGAIEQRMGRPRSSFPASQTVPGNPTF